jgi:hypothetical protein
MFFPGPADRTSPIIGQFGKTGPFGDFSLSVAFIRIENIPAINGLTLIHFFCFGHNFILQHENRIPGYSIPIPTLMIGSVTPPKAGHDGLKDGLKVDGLRPEGSYKSKLINR